ncbi:PREDICTED: probable 2-oxoglutarate-dependent dioxygenase AOP1, partial [Camelina sativa]|uniref:Probable 2-oxoglutarate-dependent dioxygenase AOP1 n=1 Tax=Camelina sativa TaxID=90675 RepID=A0ABM1QQP0_CAMSA
IRIKKWIHHSVLPLAVSVHLPVIDFSDKTLKPGSSKWDEVKIDVRKALEDYGCFQASFDKVSAELKKTVFEAVEELFKLPIQTRQRNVSTKPFHGYLSHNLYQSFGIDDANVLDKVNGFTQQLWPDHGNKNISETLHQFSEKLSELDVMVRRMIMESFGIEKYIDGHLNSTYNTLRMMEYTTPPLLDADDEESKVGLRAHTDKNMITILHQHQVDGLEVKTKDEKWIKVKPSQDHFLVMVGDSLCALLNGRVFCPYHRVMMMGKKTRYSTALFSVPKSEVIIESPEELVDEEHPRIFKTYEYKEFLHFLTTEAGRSAQSALHAFAAL